MRDQLYLSYFVSVLAVLCMLPAEEPATGGEVTAVCAVVCR
jgi:hypothetical protein